MVSEALWDRLAGSHAKVADELRRHGALTRNELVDLTGLSRQTVVSVVADLRGDGLLVEREGQRDQMSGQAPMGRRPMYVALDRSAGVAVGIDLGKQQLRVAIADLSHEVLAERQVAIALTTSPGERVEKAAHMLGEVLSEARVTPDSVLGVGIAVPAPLRSSTGELRSTAMLPGWDAVSVQSTFERRLGLRVIVGNDKNLGALAEMTWGSARGVRDLIYVKWTIDVGCAVILNGHLYEGAGGIAGEMGHSPTPNGTVYCLCGNRGCLETVVNTGALLAAVAPAVGELTADGFVARAVAGDPVCKRALLDAAAVVGESLAPLVNLLNPGLVVIGSLLGRAGDLVVDAVKESARRGVIAPAMDDVRFVASALDDRAEVLGAIALVLRQAGLGIDPYVGAEPAQVSSPTGS